MATRAVLLKSGKKPLALADLARYAETSAISMAGEVILMYARPMHGELRLSP